VGEDRSKTEHGPDRRRVTVAEAAEILGITAEAVRTRIKRDKLDSVKEPPDRTGTVYVLLEADQTGPNTDPTSRVQDQTAARDELVGALREQVAYLQGVITTRDRELEQRAEEIRRRDAALEREQQLAAIFADRLRELEAPREPREAPETVEEEREKVEPTSYAVEVHEAPQEPPEASETVEAEQERDTERSRRQMAESTLRAGMDEEQRRREEAERERDDLRRELHALREARESPQTVEEATERAEPRPATEGAQEGMQRPWWRRVFGG